MSLTSSRMRHIAEICRQSPWALPSAALATVLAVAGCGQFEVRGPGEVCQEPPSLEVVEIKKCKEDQRTLLRAKHTIFDLTAKGQLRDPALGFRGRRVRHALALDYSGSMYGGYNRSQPATPGECGWSPGPDGQRRRQSPYYWELADFAELLEGGPLAAVGIGEPIHALVFSREVVLIDDQSESVFPRAGGSFPHPLPRAYGDPHEALRRLSATGGGTLPPDPKDAPFGPAGMHLETRLNLILDAGAALFEEFEERDGLLWIVTDNIIEEIPQGAPDSPAVRNAQRNREFYETLKSNPRWQVVYAWPIHRAQWLCGDTLMVYAFYYSSRERIDEPALKDLITGEPARLDTPEHQATFQRYASSASPAPGLPFKLKPQDIGVVELSFVGRIKCQPVRIEHRGRCLARLKIINLMNHRQVDHAVLVMKSGRADPFGIKADNPVPVRIAAPLCSGAATKRVTVGQRIPPKGEIIIPIEFDVEPVQTELNTFADHYESANFSTFLMIGSMTVRIEDLRTSLVIPPARIADVYGVDAMPRIFQNPITDHFNTSICLLMPIDNPSYFVSLLIVTLAIVSGVMILLVFWIIRPLYRMAVVDGVDRDTVRMIRILSQPILVDGTEVVKARRRFWSGEPAIRPAPGFTVKKRSPGWEYSRIGDDFSSPRFLELRRVGGRTAPARGDSF